MVTVALLSPDPRLASQIQNWLGQLPQPVRFESYASMDEFFADPPPTDVHDEQAAGEEKPSEGQSAAVPAVPSDGYRVFIVDVDLIHQKPIQALLEFQAKFKEKSKKAAGENPPRIMVLCYHEGLPRPVTFQHSVVDDLVLKPIDRSLFLQKMEILISEDPKITPSFLFRQKAEMPVEVGKEVVIDEVSEFSISMRNPGPLKEGLFASIHASIFGEKESGRVIGRVFESGLHPIREGEHIVRFAYFGISAEQLANIRRFVRAQQTQVRTKGLGARAPAIKKIPTTQQDPSKIRKFAVIDMSPVALNDVKNAIESAVRDISVKAFPSYARFMADLLRLVASAGPAAADAADAAMPASSTTTPSTASGAASSTTEGTTAAPEAAPPAVAADVEVKTNPILSALPGGSRLSLFLRGGSYELTRFEPVPLQNDHILGRLAKDWLDKPELFAASVDKEDHETFKEFVECLEAGANGRAVFRMRDAHDNVVYIDAAGVLEKSGAVDGVAVLRLQIQEIDFEKWQESSHATHASLDASAYKFEAIFIEASFLRPDPVTWYEKLVELLQSAKVLAEGDPLPRIFVLAEPQSRFKPEEFRAKGIVDFIYKPLDRRYVALKFQALAGRGLHFQSEPDFPPYVPCEIHAKLGKEVQMDELSEFSLSIAQKSPFREKVFIHFFSPLLGESTWITGRCTHCVKDGESDGFKCYFAFFGPTDDLLQRIRRWIREDYVHKKEGASS
jgi:hypothetical protein